MISDRIARDFADKYDFQGHFNLSVVYIICETFEKTAGLEEKNYVSWMQSILPSKFEEICEKLVMVNLYVPDRKSVV